MEELLFTSPSEGEFMLVLLVAATAALFEIAPGTPWPPALLAATFDATLKDENERIEGLNYMKCSHNVLEWNYTVLRFFASRE